MKLKHHKIKINFYSTKFIDKENMKHECAVCRMSMTYMCVCVRYLFTLNLLFSHTYNHDRMIMIVCRCVSVHSNGRV